MYAGLVPRICVIFIFLYQIIQIDRSIMPLKKFRSISISDSTYTRFSDDYLKNSDGLAVLGVHSLSGYMSYLLESRMQEDRILARHVPMIKKVSVDAGRAVLLDNTIDRIAEVVARDGELRCQLCAKNNCLHVGFAYALPEISTVLASGDAE